MLPKQRRACLGIEIALLIMIFCLWHSNALNCHNTDSKIGVNPAKWNHYNGSNDDKAMADCQKVFLGVELRAAEAATNQWYSCAISIEIDRGFVQRMCQWGNCTASKNDRNGTITVYEPYGDGQGICHKFTMQDKLRTGRESTFLYCCCNLDGCNRDPEEINTDPEWLKLLTAKSTLP